MELKPYEMASKRRNQSKRGEGLLDGLRLILYRKNDRCFSNFDVEVKIESEPQIDFAAWAVFDLRDCIILGLGIWIVG